MAAHTLPAFPTPFIGRADEIAELSQLLDNPDCRLLTLVGPGGIGKTRLAVEVARCQLDTFPDGIYFVALQPLRQVENIVTTIIDALPLQLVGNTDPLALLLNYLRDKRLLLVLDNFEHLLTGTDIVTTILNATAQVKLLVTSRENLNLQAEQVWPMAGLEVTDDASTDSPQQPDAVQLFVERAQRVRPDFALADHRDGVIHICRLVDGLPLALELAASWTRVMPCETIADEIQRSIDILATTKRDIPERHQSMRAVFDHSWHLLTVEEQTAFCKLAVFRGGFRADAASKVAGASLHKLTSLIDKSLVQVLEHGRYDLHEMVRQYAEEHLEVLGATNETQDEHCRYYAGFLHDYEADLKGRRQLAAVKAIEADLDNVRGAWHRAATHRYEREIALAANTLFLFCQIGSRQIELTQLMGLALSNMGDDVVAGRILRFKAMILLQIGFPEGLSLLRRGRDIGQVHGFVEMDIVPLHILSFRTLPIEEYALLGKIYRQQIRQFEEDDAQWGIAWCTLGLGNLAFWVGRDAEARSQIQRSVEIFAMLGDRWAEGWAWDAVGILGEHQGSHEDARRAYQQAIAIYEAIEDWGSYAHTWGRLGSVVLRQGDTSTARRCLQESLRVITSTSSTYLTGQKHEILLYAAELQVLDGYREHAVELLAMLAGQVGLWDIYRNQVEHRLAELRGQLPADVFNTAVEKGEQADPTLTAAAVAEEFSALLQGAILETSPANQPLVEPLTPRELEVLALLAEGFSNAQIARHLFITVGTVKGHTSNIYSKLDVKNRNQAVVNARTLGIL